MTGWELIRSREPPLVLIRAWLAWRTLDVGNDPTAGAARDTNRDTK